MKTKHLLQNTLGYGQRLMSIAKPIGSANYYKIT